MMHAIHIHCVSYANVVFLMTCVGVDIHTHSTESKCSNVFKADAVIVTVPLGVLKSGAIAFNPPLPEWKQQAINNLGFGLLNKVHVYVLHVWSLKCLKQTSYILYTLRFVDMWVTCTCTYIVYLNRLLN